MQIATNHHFGTGALYEIEDIREPIHCVCTACMSVWADFLSWANANPQRMRRGYARDGDAIIVLSCQVTDLAILNDLRTVESLQKQFPYSKVYVGGCLAQRFDIDITHRLHHVRCDGTLIENRDLIEFADPFWAPNYRTTRHGHLFRDMYPIRLGVGCHGKCAYCTIRHTRGPAYQVDPEIIEQHFQAARKQERSAVLIADSPTVEQIQHACEMATRHRVHIGIRNIEPPVADRCWREITKLARDGRLGVFHCPIQSIREDILHDMQRDVDATTRLLSLLYQLSHTDTVCATNIIVDYKDFPNTWVEEVYEFFDYVSWNPYWDGQWDRETAELRWRRYFEA